MALLSMTTHGVALVAACLAGTAVLLGGRRRPELTRTPDQTTDRTDERSTPQDDRPFAVRHRVSLSALLAAGVWLVVGGVAGSVVAALAGATAWRVLGRVEGRVGAERRRQLRRDLPPAIDLVVTVLEAGGAPGPALGLVGEAFGGPVGEELCAIRSRLALGADPHTVWAAVARRPDLGPLGRAFARATATGASVAGAGHRLAIELRERRASEVEARARAVSTKAAAPLGACFLPAFVLLGIVPLVAGLLGTMSFGS